MTLARHILSYGTYNAVNAAVPFFLIPVLTTYLSPEEYGLLSLAQLLMTLTLPLVVMNTHGLFVIECTRSSQRDLLGLVSAMVWLPVLGCALVGAVFWVFLGPLALLFKLPESLVVAIPFFCLAQSVPTLVPVIFQARQESGRYGAFKIALSLVNLALSIGLVVALVMGWQGRLWGIVGANLAFTVFGLLILWRQCLLRLELSAPHARAALRFGLPLIPHTLAGILLAMADRVFLANLVSPAEAGVYSVAYQLASGLSILLSSINQAWAPHLFDRLNQNPGSDEKRALVLTTYRIMLLMAGMTLAFVAAVNPLYDLFIGAEFHSGKAVAMVLAGAFCLQGGYFMVTNYIFYSKKTHLLSAVTVTCLGVSLAGNVLLTPILGAVGAALTMVIVWGSMFALTWSRASRAFPMPWHSRG